MQLALIRCRFMLFALLVALVLAASVSMDAQRAPSPTGPAPTHAQAVKRLLIKNAMVIYGNAKPAFGPVDILVQDGIIARVGSMRKDDPPADAVIDATGKYVMPGIVNAHMHLQDERGGIPQPFQYEMNLYLASGVTTIRDMSSDLEKAKKWRAQSAAHEIAAPRILIYSTVWGSKGTDPAQIREGVRFAKAQGVDGLKIFGIDRDRLEPLLDEAKKQGMRSAAHIAVEETTAKDFAELGITSIEHFYGIPEAAMDGIQNFPPDHNANNEIHRFGRAGELYSQANLNPQKLSDVLGLMVRNNVTWVPTFSIYAASRDLIRSQNLPWYKEYLHPAMEEYFKPDLRSHGAYFLGWTNTQEVRWKKSFQVWMNAVREFALKGGNVAVGDDAGFINSLYGFGTILELEMMEEAGFSPLEVIKNATLNGAKVIGMDDRLGKVRQGFVADLLVVNGNPLDNLHLLNPYGTDIMTVNGKPVPSYAPVTPGDPAVKNVHGGGVEWTIKDGIPYHVPTIMKETREMVASARAERAKKSPKP